MNEFLRIFWNGNREEVAKAIRELLQFDVPVVGIFGGKILIQRTDLSPEEEILLLLHHAGENGFPRRKIGESVQFSPSTVTKALQKLASRDFRQLVTLSDGNYRLTDLGSRRVREELGQKLGL